MVRAYRAFVESGRAAAIAAEVAGRLRRGGRVFFTGCGSTGRLSIQLVSIWRDFWQRQRARGLACQPPPETWEDRAFSVMAGGDFALIKSVEGFEDFTAFGKKQIGDLGVSDRDAVFAITEGGETSFVIGTAWKGIDAGAKVYFVYNNPDAILCAHVERSREVIQDARIEKINLTTGPMAITGSTRMQATTIQLCVMLTVMEMVLRDLHRGARAGRALCPRCPPEFQGRFLSQLEQMLARLKAPALLDAAGRTWCEMEEATYRAGRKHNYYADRYGIDVLTDTTERSPTYCTPPFRKFDDKMASESWAFLFVPDAETPAAWERLIKRRPACVEWSEAEVRALVTEDKLERTLETVRKINCRELMRFKVGLDGLPGRRLGPGDTAAAVVDDAEVARLASPDSFHRARLEEARQAGARIALIAVARDSSLEPLRGGALMPGCLTVAVGVPGSDFLLDGVARAGLKMLLNALSTCTMVRLGRVMGNYMVWLVPSNLKLIDRATRYIEKLAGLEYVEANRLLFEIIEYVEPRMKADQAYPPAVGLAVTRVQHGLGNEEAERRLLAS